MRHTTFNPYEEGDQEASTAENLALAATFITAVAIGELLAESL